MNENRWICESEKEVITSPVMQMIEQNCRSSEDDRRQKFYVLRSKDWCNIIPITSDGKVVMVRQYRIGIAAHTLEVPGGVMDASDEHAEAAAIREMTEETGYVPMEGCRCIALGSSLPNPAILNNRVHSFIVGPVHKTGDQNLDSGEMIEIVEVPIEEIPERIVRGEIDHSLMLNTFFFAALRLDLGSKDLSGALTRQLESFRCGARGPGSR